LFVQSNPGAAIDLTNCLDGSAAAAPYHNPRYIEVVAAFERTPSQRIAKQALSRRHGRLWNPCSPELEAALPHHDAQAEDPLHRPGSAWR
jgi:hypothetical protein